MSPHFVIIVASLTTLLLVSCENATNPPKDTASSSSPASASSSSSAEASSVRQVQIRDISPTEERIVENGLLEIGAEDAPLTLLLFTNEACGYCKTFAETLLPRLKRDFITKGFIKLRIAILPIKKYPLSRYETAAIICGARQGKGLLMHETLFMIEKRDRTTITNKVPSMKIDKSAWQTCMDATDTQDLLDQQDNLARELNVTLVPTLFLEKEKSVGLPTYADLKGWIMEKLLPS